MSSSDLQNTTNYRCLSPNCSLGVPRRHRVSQDTHEAEIFEGDPQETYRRCKKNPGHERFIPAGDFSIVHLPKEFQHQDLFDLIQAQANLTVRLTVDYISLQRPEFYPGKEERYPLYDKRGTKTKLHGTGSVAFVTKLRKWRGQIEVYTANHVVFDEIEAKHTTVTFFDDLSGRDVVTLGGWTIDMTNVEADNCKIKLLVNDDKLLDMLDRSWETFASTKEKVNKRYGGRDEPADIAIIVSHPHGCAKQISVGNVTDMAIYGQEQGFNLSKYTYTTCTCPGSSGAPIYIPGCKEYTPYGHRHSGSYGSEINLSGTAWNITR